MNDSQDQHGEKPQGDSPEMSKAETEQNQGRQPQADSAPEKPTDLASESKAPESPMAGAGASGKSEDSASENATAALPDGQATPKTQPPATPSVPPKEGIISRNFVGIILVALLAELFIYGRRGSLDVCVAKDKIHDFALLGQERTEKNRWAFPHCEQRTNLSMFGKYEDVVSDAKRVACRRATLVRQRGEANQCVFSKDGWKFRVQARQVWPWEEPFYRSMLHLD